MPTAGPQTAAITGLGKAAMVRRKRIAGDSFIGVSAGAPAAAMKSAMSLPALKMVGSPWISTARTAPSADGLVERRRERVVHRAGDRVLAGDAVEGEGHHTGFGVDEDVAHGHSLK